MKKKLIIHIGTPKTGSSYLQEVFVKNYEKLLALEILYPGVSSGSFIKRANTPINASHILDIFRNNKNKELTCSLLIESLEKVFSFGVPTVLISDETFSALEVTNEGNLYIFECLIEACKKLNIEISFIAYFRKPSKYLPSHWAQVVKKHKETLPLVDFVQSNKINYWANLINLHRLHKKSLILSYDSEILTEGGLSNSFFSGMNLDYRKIDTLTNYPVNQSLSLNSLTALRLINAEFDDITIRKIESILSNANPTLKLDKPKLSKEIENLVDELYSFEWETLNSIACSKKNN